MLDRRGQECSQGSCSGCRRQGSVKLSDLPEETCPGVHYSVRGLEVGDIGSVGDCSVFDPMVFFGNTVVVDDNSGSPQEIQEVDRAGSNTATFV